MVDNYEQFFDFYKNNVGIKRVDEHDELCIPVRNYDFDTKNSRFKTENVTVDEKDFKMLYDEFTHGLCKYLPEQPNCYVHPGGSLHDILTHNFVSVKRLRDSGLPHFLCDIIKEYIEEDIIDIDIFLYGYDDNVKLNVIKEFIKNVSKKYEISIEMKYAIVNITFKNISRIVQFIITNKISSIDIVSRFDSGHVMMYYKNKILYMNKICKSSLKTGISVYVGVTNYNKRIYKHIKRNYKVGIPNKILIDQKDYDNLTDIDYYHIKKLFLRRSKTC